MNNAVNEMMFPTLSKFVMSILALPHSSAAAERVFSQLNLIKTKTRNRLEVQTCDAILHAKEICQSTECFKWKPSDHLVNKK